MKFVIDNIVKSYGKDDKPVIDGASFTFEEGKIYGLLGRNGSGKTTLFNCINGDIPFNSGEFYFIEEPNDRKSKATGPIIPEASWTMDSSLYSPEAQGVGAAALQTQGAGSPEAAPAEVPEQVAAEQATNQDAESASSGTRRQIEAEDIGYVLSTPTVPEFLTGREFLKFFLDINKNAGSPSDIERYFQLVRLSNKDMDKLMKNYSHGMKNKMQMLVNMLAQPKLLLLDEPLTSLDVVVAEEMKELLRSFKDGRITIFSTHILDLAVDLCDEIVLLSKGRLEAVDHAALDNEGFKSRIIELLKDEDTADDEPEEATAETPAVDVDVVNTELAEASEADINARDNK